MEFIANYHDYGFGQVKVSCCTVGEMWCQILQPRENKQRKGGYVGCSNHVGIVLQAPSWTSLFTSYSSYSSLTSSPPTSLPSFFSRRNLSYHHLTRHLRSLRTASSHRIQIYHPSFGVCSAFRWMMHGHLEEVWILCRLWKRLQEQRRRDPLR